MKSNLSNNIKDSDAEGSLVEVSLTHGRWRHLTGGTLWVVAAVLVGLHMDGGIGIVLAIALGATGLWSLRSFAITLLHPAGVISIRRDEIELPPKLCAGSTVTVPFGELQNAYVLSRSVPFYTTAPLLVVETRRGVFEYPRDWFGGESDQRRVSRTLNRRMGRI